MRSTGSPDQWKRFLESKSGSDASATLSVRVREIDTVYTELSSCLVKLWECPMSEIPDALLIARSALAETMALLEHVRFRIEDEDRGAA